MIVEKLANLLRRQDWAAVSLELLILIVGVFLGLQVNDWNEARKNRILEREYLGRLQADMRWNIENFLNLQSIFEPKAAFINSLRQAPASEPIDYEPAELLKRLNYSTYVALPAVRRETFSELESSGRISLLRDLKLRTEVASFYANYQLMQEILAKPVGDYKRLVSQELPGNVAYDLALTGKPDLDAVSEALTRLQGDPRFESAANSEMAYAADLIVWLRRFRVQAENIVESIGELDHEP